MLHRFGCSGGTTVGGIRLSARARQFSSFILLLGKIADAKTFAPECAMIIKDKDDLKIPLMLESMPSAKEFQDAVSSLSPEQQRFCRAYRSKQLASSVFAICTIEVKAMMEKVLNVDKGSLTKELSLTKSLMDLFIRYQISPDLLSFDGDDNLSSKEKIQRVRENNDAIQKVVNDEKMKEIEEAKKRAEIERREQLEYVSSDCEESDCEETEYELSKCMDSFDDDGCIVDGLFEVEEKLGGEVEEELAEEMNTEVDESSEKHETREKDETSEKDETRSSKEEEKILTSRVINSGDYTKLPALLNEQFERLDVDNAIRPTKINTSDCWKLSRQNGLLVDPETIVLFEDLQHKERNAAYDLLDALTRSGVLSVDCAQFHVVVAATHFFGKNLMDTVVKDNVNPIEKVERSHLIMASTIFGKSVQDLVQSSELSRVYAYSKMLRDS